jgi:hypothetical protein
MKIIVRFYLSRSVLLRIRNVVEKLVKNSKHISYAQYFFFRKLCRLCEKVEKLYIEWGRPQMTIRCRRIICWITKARSTHLHYVILIAFQLKMFARKRLYVTLCLHCLHRYISHTILTEGPNILCFSQ